MHPERWDLYRSICSHTWLTDIKTPANDKNRMDALCMAEFPSQKCGSGGRQCENQQEEGSFLEQRVAGTDDTNPHVDR
jgi:hypothetical protein